MDVLLDGQTALTRRTRWTLETRRFSVQCLIVHGLIFYLGSTVFQLPVHCRVLYLHLGSMLDTTIATIALVLSTVRSTATHDPQIYTNSACPSQQYCIRIKG